MNERNDHPSVYIPPSYRGNALFLESLGRESECAEKRDGGQDGECGRDRTAECECERKCEKTPVGSERGIGGRLSGLLSSDSAVVIAVVLFLLFSRKDKKDKKDESGDDLLTVLLLALVLL